MATFFSRYPSTNDDLVNRTVYAEHEKHVVFYALQAKLFDVIKNEGALSRTELIERCKFGKRGGEAVINVVTALKYLRCVDGKYYLTDASEEYFVSTSLFYLGYNIMTQYVENSEVKTAWEQDKNGKEIVKSSDMWKNASINEEDAVSIGRFMNALSIAPAIAFGDRINLKQRYNVDSFVDIGAGSGCFSLSAVAKQSGLKAIMLDLPLQCKTCEFYRDQANVPSDRALTYACNMFTEPFPLHNDPKYGYQAMFLSNILHDWNDETCKTLCKKIYDALPSNGYILISEVLFNDDGNGPLHAALFSFHMFIYCEGKQFTFGELKQMLTEIGFVGISHENVYNAISLVSGRKP